MTENRTRSQRMMFGCVGVSIGIILALAFFVPRLVTTYKGAKKLGLFEEQQMREYAGTSKENLKAIYTAMSLYHDSEGGYPPSDVWMDRIEIYLKTADLSSEEAEKKLKNPLVTAENPQGFGYAMNDQYSNGFKLADGASSDDPSAIADPDRAILIFDSSDLTKNAHGNPVQLAPEPERPGGNLATNAAGSVDRLSKLLGR